MYNSLLSYSFSLFYFSFSRRIWCPPMHFHHRPSDHSRIQAAFCLLHFFQARFSWCYRILLILHIFGADAFCPVFINLPAPIFMMYLAGQYEFIFPSFSNLFLLFVPAFSLLLLSEVVIIFRCKDSVQPGVAYGLCQWRVCENLPLSGLRFGIKPK